MNQICQALDVATDRRLLYLLQRASRAAIARANTRTVEQLGVSATQLATLAHLAKQPGSTMTDIADLFDLNKSAVSGMLSRLEKAGLVERRPNPKDGRGSLLFLTDRGESVRASAMPLVKRATAELTDGFSAAEVDVIYRFLNAIVERYSEDGEATS